MAHPVLSQNQNSASSPPRVGGGGGGGNNGANIPPEIEQVAVALFHSPASTLSNATTARYWSSPSSPSIFNRASLSSTRCARIVSGADDDDEETDVVGNNVEAVIASGGGSVLNSRSRRDFVSSSPQMSPAIVVGGGRTRAVRRRARCASSPLPQPRNPTPTVIPDTNGAVQSPREGLFRSLLLRLIHRNRARESAEAAAAEEEGFYARAESGTR